MVGEIYAGLGALKAMLDTVKSLKDLSDTAGRNRVTIELTEKIIIAQEAQTALVEQVRALEKEIAASKTWDAEKVRYDLKDFGNGALAFMLKPEARGRHPPHLVCTNCYAQGKASILLGTGQTVAARPEYCCP